MNRLGRDGGDCTNSLVPWQMKIKAFGSKLHGFHPQVNSLMPLEFTINSYGDWVAELEKVTNDRATVFTLDPACSDSMNRPLHIWYRRCTCTRPAKMTLGSFRHVSQEYENHQSRMLLNLPWLSLQSFLWTCEHDAYACTCIYIAPWTYKSIPCSKKASQRYGTV
jgi:hypothetical protein